MTVRGVPLRLTAVLLPLGLGAAATWPSAVAVWTGGVVATSTVATGRLDLTLDGAQGPTTTWSGLTVSGLLPTDVVHASLTVANAGTVPLTWSLATTVTGSTALAAALTVGVREVASSCSAATWPGGTVLAAESAGLTSAAVAGRPLAPGATAVLCVRVTLPSGAASSLQGTSVTPSFAVTATS